jgi:hypothetical protein
MPPARELKTEDPGDSTAVDTKTAGPTRVDCAEIRVVERSDVAQAEAEFGVSLADAFDVRFTERTGGPTVSDGVPIRDRDRHLQGAHRRDQPGDGHGGTIVETEGAAQQRAPREADRDEVGESSQLAWQRLNSGRNERGVGQAALLGVSSRAAGGLGHGTGVGIDADGERRRIGSRCREDGAAVPGSKVDDGPAMSPGQCRQLADVDVDDPAAGHDAHGAQYAIRRSVAPA